MNTSDSHKNNNILELEEETNRKCNKLSSSYVDFPIYNEYDKLHTKVITKFYQTKSTEEQGTATSDTAAAPLNKSNKFVSKFKLFQSSSSKRQLAERNMNIIKNKTDQKSQSKDANNNICSSLPSPNSFVYCELYAEEKRKLFVDSKEPTPPPPPPTTSKSSEKKKRFKYFSVIYLNNSKIFQFFFYLNFNSMFRDPHQKEITKNQL
jgi:hypothetical protein